MNGSFRTVYKFWDWWGESNYKDESEIGLEIEI